MVRHRLKISLKSGNMLMVFISIFVAVCGVNLLFAQQVAFPTAEGSGRFATGGRGGTVYEVTNLSNSGPGSIVDAVSQTNRTIVFRVSGIIELGSVLLQPKSNTTIAGQTAPGDGICIKGRILIGNVSNVIIRYIRVRVDAGLPNADGDAVDIAGGASCQNIIIDHVSASYSRDEGISCRENNTKVTVQWCIISEGLLLGGGHSYGSLVRGDYGDRKTYHHNLYAHNLGRNPRPGNYTAVGTDPEGLYFDFRNNVIYNWQANKPGYNDDIDKMSRYNFIGNVYIRGLESITSTKAVQAFRENCLICYGYFENNSYDDVVPIDSWSLVSFQNFTADQIAAYKARSYLIPMEPVRTTSPDQAKIEVLASAGASFPKRDTIDSRIVNDVINKTGRFLDSTAGDPNVYWPPLNSTSAPTDSDHDGMPDDWEVTRGLNPNDASDRNSIGQDGYTQLEVYLNSLTGEIVVGVDEIAASQPKVFALHQNYPNPFNPTTTITYSVVGTYNYMSLRVFDVLGREVATLVNSVQEPGNYSVPFNASELASGIYFYQLRAGSFVQTKKLVLMK